jgi:hypothetical protein
MLLVYTSELQKYTMSSEDTLVCFSDTFPEFLQQIAALRYGPAVKLLRAASLAKAIAQSPLWSELILPLKTFIGCERSYLEISYLKRMKIDTLVYMYGQAANGLDKIKSYYRTALSTNTALAEGVKERFEGVVRIASGLHSLVQCRLTMVPVFHAMSATEKKKQVNYAELLASTTMLLDTHWQQQQQSVSVSMHPAVRPLLLAWRLEAEILKLLFEIQLHMSQFQAKETFVLLALCRHKLNQCCGPFTALRLFDVPPPVEDSKGAFAHASSSSSFTTATSASASACAPVDSPPVASSSPPPNTSSYSSSSSQHNNNNLDRDGQKFPAPSSDNRVLDSEDRNSVDRNSNPPSSSYSSSSSVSAVASASKTAGSSFVETKEAHATTSTTSSSSHSAPSSSAVAEGGGGRASLLAPAQSMSAAEAKRSSRAHTTDNVYDESGPDVFPTFMTLACMFHARLVSKAAVYFHSFLWQMDREVRRNAYKAVRPNLLGMCQNFMKRNQAVQSFHIVFDAEFSDYHTSVVDGYKCREAQDAPGDAKGKHGNPPKNQHLEGLSAFTPVFQLFNAQEHQKTSVAHWPNIVSIILDEGDALSLGQVMVFSESSARRRSGGQKGLPITYLVHKIEVRVYAVVLHTFVEVSALRAKDETNKHSKGYAFSAALRDFKKLVKKMRPASLTAPLFSSREEKK